MLQNSIGITNFIKRDYKEILWSNTEKYVGTQRETVSLIKDIQLHKLICFNKNISRIKNFDTLTIKPHIHVNNNAGYIGCWVLTNVPRLVTYKSDGFLTGAVRRISVLTPPFVKSQLLRLCPLLSRRNTSRKCAQSLSKHMWVYEKIYYCYYRFGCKRFIL